MQLHQQSAEFGAFEVSHLLSMAERRTVQLVQLSRSDILDAAVAILDEYGLVDLTMRRLAAALSVQPGALYWHFPNKQTLLAAVADRITDDVDEALTESTAAWPELVRALAARLREALLAHRDGAEVVSASYASGLANARGRDAFAAALRRGGLDPTGARLGAAALQYFVLGQALDQQSREQLEAAGARTRASVAEGEQPAPLEVTGAETDSDDDRFRFGLELLIGGIGAELVRPSGVRPR